MDPFESELGEILELHDRKRSDYTGGGTNHPLANYRDSSALAGLPAYMGMFVRLGEKVHRLKSIFAKGASDGSFNVAYAEESVTDTLRDIAIIAILMKLNLTPGSGYETERANA